MQRCRQRVFALCALCVAIAISHRSVLTAVEAAAGPPSFNDQSPAAAAAAHGRSLLQNPDRPALNKYGGVDMQTTMAAGYPLEEHKVTTPDGWVLNLYRIPHGKNRNTQRGSKPVIYLHHGITLSSSCFTLLNENESMAYILADAGFDVWMSNTRGNVYSRGNWHYSHRDPEYWYHSFDEYSLIDNPAMINHALEVSGAKKLAFVGHSQGGTVGYAMLAARPEMNDKISVLLQMGPAAFIEFWKPPFLSNAANKQMDNFLRLVDSGEFLWYRMFAPLIPQCHTSFWQEACVSALTLPTTYGPSDFISVDDWSAIAQTWPASVSSRNMRHWVEISKSDQLRFQHFDYGTNCSVGHSFMETCNQQKYGTLEPPEYDLGNVRVPVVIFGGEMDLMSTWDDVAEQKRRLRNTQVIEIIYQQYGHMDFVWDRNARHMLDMVDVAFRYSPGTY